MTTTEFEAALTNVPRQGTEAHSWLIYGLIRQRRPQVVVETGTYGGYVTAHIARALLENGDGGKLYSVDNYEYGEVTPEQVRDNLYRARVRDAVEIVVCASLDWEWPAKVDMAVFDGSRVLPGFAEEVRRALDAGATCFTLHDTHHDPAALHYMRQFAAFVPDWESINCPMRGGLMVAIKTEAGEPTDLTGYVVTDAPEFRLPNGVRIGAVRGAQA